MTNASASPSSLTDVDPLHRNESCEWPALKAHVATLIKTRSRDEWRELLEGTDVCFAPVLGLEEAPRHPHTGQGPQAQARIRANTPMRFSAS